MPSVPSINPFWHCVVLYRVCMYVCCSFSQCRVGVHVVWMWRRGLLRTSVLEYHWLSWVDHWRRHLVICWLDWRCMVRDNRRGELRVTRRRQVSRIDRPTRSTGYLRCHVVAGLRVVSKWASGWSLSHCRPITWEYGIVIVYRWVHVASSTPNRPMV